MRKLSTVYDLKHELAITLKAEEPRFEIVFQGKTLLNERTLESYGIGDGSRVYFVLKPKKIENDHPKNKQHFSQSDATTLDALPSGEINKAFIGAMKNNPELLSQLFDSIPGLKEVKEQNPEIQHMLNNVDEDIDLLEMVTNTENKQQSALFMDKMLDQIDNLPINLARVNQMMDDITEPITDPLFSQPKMQTFLPTQKLPKPSENPLPIQQGISFIQMPVGTLQDQQKSERISHGLARLREAIEQAEKRGIRFPNKEKVYRKVSTESKHVLMQGKIQQLKTMYSMQLNQLKDIGFINEDDNIEALCESSGDIKGAITYLMRLTREINGK